MKSLTRKQVSLVVILCLALAAGLTWFFSARRMTLPKAAQVYAKCVQSLNTNCLYGLSSEEEREALSLTKEKVDRLVKLYLEPRMAGVSKRQGVGLNFDQDNLQIAYFGLWVGPRQVNSTGTVFASPKGPRASLVEDLTVLGLNLDTARSNPEGRDDTNFAQNLPHVNKQIADLKATGLPGFYEASTGKLIRWEVFEARITELGMRQANRN